MRSLGPPSAWSPLLKSHNALSAYRSYATHFDNAFRQPIHPLIETNTTEPIPSLTEQQATVAPTQPKRKGRLKRNRTAPLSKRQKISPSSTPTAQSAAEKLRDAKFSAYFTKFKNAARIDLEPVVLQRTAPERNLLPRLISGIEKVLFNPGVVHRFKDARSGQYNFGKEVERIPHPDEMKLEALSNFTPPSQDERLFEMMKKGRIGFGGSTSSLVPALAQIWCMFHPSRQVDMRQLSQLYTKEPRTLTRASVRPSRLTGYRREKSWIFDRTKVPLDSDSHFLSKLGNIGEKQLTRTAAEFDACYLSSPDPFVEQASAYAYARGSNILMRSQIDCFDPNLPGDGTFDIKTRAVASIRYDPLNADINKYYYLKTINGMYESYEWETYHMMRNAFLKYFFQAQIGGMDGIFCAHHNTTEYLGFVYWSMDDLAAILAPRTGSREEADLGFRLSITVFENVIETVFKDVPEEFDRVNVVFEAVEALPVLNVHVKMGEDERKTYFTHQFFLSSENGVFPNRSYTLQHRSITDRKETFALYKNAVLKSTHNFKAPMPDNMSSEDAALVAQHNKAQTSSKQAARQVNDLTKEEEKSQDKKGTILTKDADSSPASNIVSGDVQVAEPEQAENLSKDLTKALSKRKARREARLARKADLQVAEQQDSDIAQGSSKLGANPSVNSDAQGNSTVSTANRLPFELRPNTVYGKPTWFQRRLRAICLRNKAIIEAEVKA